MKINGFLTDKSDMQAIQKHIESCNITEQQTKQIEFHTVWGYNRISGDPFCIFFIFSAKIQQSLYT